MPRRRCPKFEFPPPRHLGPDVMNEDLLGYLLNLDVPEERSRTAERLRNDPEAAARRAAVR